MDATEWTLVSLPAHMQTPTFRLVDDLLYSLTADEKS